MTACKRLVAGLTLLLAAVGFLLGLAGGIGVWIVKQPATERTAHIFGRIEAAFDLAERGLDQVQTSLDRAAERLETVKEEQRKLAQEPRQTNTLGRLLARTVQQRVMPEVDNAHETLHSVAEAAVVINSVLEDVGSFPFVSASGLDLEAVWARSDRPRGS